MPRKITVIGAGNMGHGLATHFALNNWNVMLVDHRQSNFNEAEARIREVVRFHNEEGVVVGVSGRGTDAHLQYA